MNPAGMIWGGHEPGWHNLGGIKLGRVSWGAIKLGWVIWGGGYECFFSQYSLWAQNPANSILAFFSKNIGFWQKCLKETHINVHVTVNFSQKYYMLFLAISEIWPPAEKKAIAFFCFFSFLTTFLFCQFLAKTWRETLKIKIFSPKWSTKGFSYDMYFSSYDNSFLWWSRDFVKYEISL